MKKLFLALIGLGTLSLAACVQPPAPPVIDLNPQPSLQTSSIGQGQAIAVQVIDARTPGFGQAHINPQQNVAAVFTNQLVRAVNAYGFSAVTLPQQAHQSRLILRILSINYGAAKGYFSANTETTVSAQVDAQTAQGTYTQTYTASAYSDSYLKSAPQTASQQVNTAVNQLLTNLFNDQALWQFLARG